MTESQLPDVLRELELIVEDVCNTHGAEELAPAIAFDVIERLRLHWGGADLYLPKATLWALGRRDAEIYRKFTGTNVPALAREYSLTERQIYAIIARCRKAHIDRTQIKMFSEDSGA